MFAGSAHVTRMLLVEPGIPATVGAAGADGGSRTSSTMIVTDFDGDAVAFLCLSSTFTVTE